MGWSSWWHFVGGFGGWKSHRINGMIVYFIYAYIYHKGQQDEGKVYHTLILWVWGTWVIWVRLCKASMFVCELFWLVNANKFRWFLLVSWTSSKYLSNSLKWASRRQCHTNKHSKLFHGLHQLGGFKYCLFSPLLEEMIQFDYFFQRGWNHQLVLYWEKSWNKSQVVCLYPFAC